MLLKQYINVTHNHFHIANIRDRRKHMNYMLHAIKIFSFFYFDKSSFNHCLLLGHVLKILYIFAYLCFRSTCVDCRFFVFPFALLYSFADSALSKIRISVMVIWHIFRLYFHVSKMELKIFLGFFSPSLDSFDFVLFLLLQCWSHVVVNIDFSRFSITIFSHYHGIWSCLFLFHIILFFEIHS